MREKKNKFQMLSVALCMLILAFVCFSGTVEAASKVKLNKSSATIFIGKTVTLKVRNSSKEVKWSSSNEKIATVSDKGVVKGLKAGKVTIKAKAGSKTLQCKVTVGSIYSVSTKNVTINKTGKIILTFKKPNVKLNYNTNARILSCKWGKWNEGKVPLRITGVREGTAKITISNKYSSEKLIINVNVKAAK